MQRWKEEREEKEKKERGKGKKKGRQRKKRGKEGRMSDVRRAGVVLTVPYPSHRKVSTVITVSTYLNVRASSTGV